jgi:hypothetical protein
MPANEDVLVSRPVDKAVGNIRNNYPELLGSRALDWLEKAHVSSASCLPSAIRRNGDPHMRSFLILVAVIASLSGCASTREDSQPAAETTQAYAGWPRFLASPEGHQVMMKMIHRRPKTGGFGAIGS